MLREALTGINSAAATAAGNDLYNVAKGLYNEISIDRLKLNMEGITDRNEIAEQICRELKGKKCLLLLDDVRKDLDLDLSLIGMDDNERDIKVVLTTRHRHVCYDMEIDEPIKVQGLSEDDAWEMFKVKVGKNVNHKDIEPIAKLVAKECACLPLLIDKVAKIFRRKGKSPQLWDDGLSSLQRWPHIEFQGIDELIKYLEFCYEDIDDELKKIFSSGMIQQLSELQQLTVEECPEIEEIITESENNGLVPDALPRLKMLVLSNLPKVKSIWIDDSLNWPSLKRITIFKCEMLTRLPFNNENAINLKCIEADQIWWSALVWQDDTIENRLQSIWFQSA
uniref:Uncharacterized protein n=1 Tax=Fagus sylvatica TaxID=28930 RepID=A0A2N9FKL0_FAGSY